MYEESENGVNHARKASYSQLMKVFFFFAIKKLGDLGKGVAQ